MKNHLAITVLLILVSTFSWSQGDYSISFSSGIGLGSFNGDGISPDATSKIAPIFGILVEKEISGNLFLRSGLTYGKKSMEVDFPSPVIDPNDPIGESLSVEFGVNAITLPVFIGYKSDGDIKFLASGGPFVSILSGEENIFTESIDYGIGASIGLEYTLSDKGSLRFEVMNELGLADINGSQIDSNKISTNRIGAYISYTINF